MFNYIHIKLILLIFLFPLQLIAGRSYDIEFRVLDDLTDLPIADAKISIGELAIELTTDTSGYARISGCELKEFDVEISYPDYDTRMIHIERNKGKMIIRTLRLKPTPERIVKFFKELHAKEIIRFEQKKALIDTTIIPPCNSVNVRSELSWDAEFPGGAASLQRFINYTINYPKEALELGDQGIVYISAIIDFDGLLTDVIVARGVSAELDKEAKRIIASMPNWIPAYCNGRPIRTRISLPIRFAMY